MAFHWTAGPEGPADYRSQDFPTRVDAEEWLTGAYESLVDEGLLSVVLYEGLDVVYGPMSLLP